MGCETNIMAEDRNHVVNFECSSDIVSSVQTALLQKTGDSVYMKCSAVVWHGFLKTLLFENMAHVDHIKALTRNC